MWNGQNLHIGTVVHFDEDRKFGFVRDALTLTDSFFHLSDQGSLVGNLQDEEFALVQGGLCDCEPEIGDRLVYLVNPNYERGPRVTIWVDEGDYQKQLGVLRKRAADAKIPTEESKAPMLTLVASPNGRHNEPINAAY